MKTAQECRPRLRAAFPVLLGATLLASACGAGLAEDGLLSEDADDVRRACPDDENPCTLEARHARQCTSAPVPDGTACPGGACVAGICAPHGAPDAGADAATPPPDASVVPPDAGSKPEVVGKVPAVLAAFPGCQGAGCYTRGGFDTSAGTPRIYRVTSLAAGSGQGTLGECIAAAGPRVCTFAVAGKIAASYVISNPFITIRGDTAPGMGIQVGHETTGGGDPGWAVFRIDTHDVVIRGLRVRDGNVNSAVDEDNHGILAFPLRTAADGAINHVVLDHLSVTWGNDETIDFYGNSNVPASQQPRDITLSNLIVAEGLMLPTWSNQSFGALMAGSDTANCDDMTDIDVHHTYFANNKDRNPHFRIKRGRTINNVAYNSSGAWFEGGGYFDGIGNLGRYGPNWTRGHLFAVNWFKTGISCSELNLPGDSSIHLADNKMYGQPGSAPGWDTSLVYDYQDGVHVTPQRRSGPLAAAASGPAIAPDGVDQLPTLLLGAGGAGHSRRLDCGGAWVTAGVRDSVDARLIDSFFAPPAAYAYPLTPADVGGFPAITAIASTAVCSASSRDNTSCACADGDADGMPDYWEAAFCGAPSGSGSCAALGTSIAPPWTDLEAFQSGRIVAP